MTKTYKIVILLFTFIFLTTYTSKNLNIKNKEENNFFKIKKIEVTNNHRIKESIVVKRLNHIYNKNIIFLTNKDILTYLLNLDYLKRIEVKKKYPDTIIINVYETEPIAIITIKNKKFIIDSKSNLISFNNNNSIKSLPNVFGEGADKEFVDFLFKLKKYNFLTQNIKNFYYFKIGRWDLELFDNKTIKLPFENVLDSINQAKVLIEREDFKKYSIIDLRLKGKVITE